MVNDQNKNYKAVNEPIKSYSIGSNEKKTIKEQLNKMSHKSIEIPIIIGGKEIKTGNMGKCVMPHNHQHVLAHYHKSSEHEINLAIDNLLETWKSWSNTSIDYRIGIFKKMAELLKGPYRDIINASTRLVSINHSIYITNDIRNDHRIQMIHFNNQINVFLSEPLNLSPGELPGSDYNLFPHLLKGNLIF